MQVLIRVRPFLLIGGMMALVLGSSPFYTTAAGAQSKPKPSLFKPIPLTEMEADQFVAYGAMVEKRQKFLTDDSFPYLKLAVAIPDAMRTAVAALSKGDADQAMAALQLIAAIRPIEEIPTPELISLYAFILGKQGQTEKQKTMRVFLFGIDQAIGHSGDALGPNSAVPVILVSEEYAWLKDKDLTLVKQQLQQDEIHIYDVMTARNPDGMERDYYFEITPLFKKYKQTLTR